MRRARSIRCQASSAAAEDGAIHAITPAAMELWMDIQASLL